MTEVVYCVCGFATWGHVLGVRRTQPFDYKVLWNNMNKTTVAKKARAGKHLRANIAKMR